MDRRGLADFLRSKREAISPAEVRLPAGPRRRTPGLRREEAARLAFISTEYYTQLEQARAPRPSPEVLSGLVRALRLSEAERVYLHHLAGTPPDPPREPPHEVRPSIQEMISRLTHAPTFVMSAICEVIAWNDLAVAMMDDFATLDRRDRNLARRAFLAPEGQRLYGATNVEHLAANAVQELRATAARYPASRETAELVHDLKAGSAEFARLWETHDVSSQPATRKTFEHPQVGTITVDCDVLDIADRDQRVVIYTATPGSPSEEALQKLALPH